MQQLTMCDSLVALCNEASTPHLLGFWTAHVKGGSRSSHLIFIIKVTCNNCAYFGWGTQACMQAISTMDASSKYVRKYASIYF